MTTVHTNGSEFRLDIVDHAAPVGEQHWRIILRDGVLQVVLLDQRQDYTGFQVERHGAQYDIRRGRDVQL